MAVGKGSIKRAVKANATGEKMEPMTIETTEAKTMETGTKEAGIMETEMNKSESTKVVVLTAPSEEVVKKMIHTSFVNIGTELPNYLL